MRTQKLSKGEYVMNEQHLLEKINSPDDVKRLNIKELNALAAEIRQYIIQVLSKNGGHLAPNLGVVELTLALHKVFSTPQDKIVFDVGHQSYIHKIITGRREAFKTIRQYGGLSGFPKRNESAHDAFGTGHSSTSISAALGMAVARDLKHEKHEVVAVIFQRFAHRFAHGLRRREMDYRIEVVFFEHPGKGVAVAAVGLFERDVDARDPAHALDCIHVAVREIVDDHHVVPRTDQFHGGVRTDITGAAADQNTRFFHKLTVFIRTTNISKKYARPPISPENLGRRRKILSRRASGLPCGYGRDMRRDAVPGDRPTACQERGKVRPGHGS